MEQEVKDHNYDLPLVANTDEIIVKHYAIDLVCDFSKKQFLGSIILFLEPVNSGDSCKHCKSYLTTDKNYKNEVHSMQNIVTLAGECSNKTESLICCEEKEMNCISQSGDSVNSLLTESNSLDIIEHNDCVQKNNIDNLYKEFSCLLDCHSIAVEKVVELLPSNCTSPVEPITGQQILLQNKDHFSHSTELHFSVDEWSLKIWKKNVHCQHQFPRVIKIYYHTNSCGTSLLWVKNQDEKDCVYTYGAWINNRSLFPCQEPPIAMATWEAMITVPDPAIVLMSGDKEPLVNSPLPGLTQYYYFTKMTLPMSTLALVVGYWECEVIKDEGDRVQENFHCNTPCRIFSPRCLFHLAVMELSSYIPRCVSAAEFYFGSYPFPRLDIVIVPKGFGSLGMASPNIIFLSQSVLSEDGSMFPRVAHEIAHAWFGLMIGALDWTEEWLSEGFATFMEDFIHAKAMKWSLQEEKNICEVRDFLRMKTLKSEVCNTDEELQTLRPNQGDVQKEDMNGVSTVFVKNGRNPKKGFMQIHYLKGYFLLKYLSQLVGKEDFLALLKDYVCKYRGQLVESEKIFSLYLKTFPKVREKEVSLEYIYNEWLDNPGLPQMIGDYYPSETNALNTVAVEETQKWKCISKTFLKRKRGRKKQLLSFEQFIPLCQESLLLLLENLLDEDELPHQVLRGLEKVYKLANRNADVRHRWCELVVKHKYTAAYKTVKQFLCEDLAMGVYLYGELILSELPSQRRIAEQCYSEVKSEMEPNYCVTIEKMFRGTVESE